MIFKLNHTLDKSEPVVSHWVPKELDLEKYILPSNPSEPVLNQAVLGEPLLLVSNQVRTRQKKRADILCLDRAGSGVIVELKRDRGVLGVETQALQYLADFSAYQGEQFLRHFDKPSRQLETDIHSFLGGAVQLEALNKRSRVILVARGFEPALFSIGEWLSRNGVAFRCIEYTPVQIGNDKYLSFSVVFDHSPINLFPLVFASGAREPGYFWHNIGRSDDTWWRFLVQAGQISASFENRPGDAGERLLKSYVLGDIVIAYAKGFGAVGWGRIEQADSYRPIPPGSKDDYLRGEHLHRLAVKWHAHAQRLADGISPEQLRTQFGIYHPISTSVSIDFGRARTLVDALSQRFC
jgi:hypothetical protein